jgi:hypothetical protein
MDLNWTGLLETLETKTASLSCDLELSDHLDFGGDHLQVRKHLKLMLESPLSESYQLPD